MYPDFSCGLNEQPFIRYSRYASHLKRHSHKVAPAKDTTAYGTYHCWAGLLGTSVFGGKLPELLKDLDKEFRRISFTCGRHFRNHELVSGSSEGKS